MNNGRLLAIFITAATVILIVIGTVSPIQSAVATSNWGDASLLHPSSTPQAAVENLAHDIGRAAWGAAYSSLGNKGEFTQAEFQHDLTGSYTSLRSTATLENFEVRPLHATAD